MDPNRTTRRAFVGGALGAATLSLLGCGDDDLNLLDSGAPDAGSPPADGGAMLPDSARIDGGAPACADPFAGGTKLGAVPFTKEGGRPLDTLFNSGLDGRLYTDLSDLTSDKLITPNSKFFVRTRYPDLLKPSGPWKIRVSGLVSKAQDLTLSSLSSLSRSTGPVLMECSGNGRGGSFGLLSAATWEGIPLSELLNKAGALSSAKRVLIEGFDQHSQPSANNHSTPGASWVFTPDQLTSAGAHLVTRMNGAALPKDHGAPVRLLIPGWYGCTNIKWVTGIKLVGDAEPATSQMKEFASRTHQQGVPSLAREYMPAAMGYSAMPVRVEKWRVKGKLRYRVVGVIWGGSKPTRKLQIRFNPSEPYVPVQVCPEMKTNRTWSLWIHSWTPTTTGTHEIRLRVDEPNVTTIRLDAGYYRRWVKIDQL